MNPCWRLDLCAVGLAGAGVGVRVAALAVGLPPTNSDEATMGLMAVHISRGEQFPVFFYGQQYMGALEAYLSAPVFALFGPSTGWLRLQTLAWFAVLLWAVYRLGTRLYSRRLALACLALLALASDRVLKDQLIAAGGYPEIVPFAALLMLLSVRLAEPGSRRIAGYTGWGLLAGLALWDDWIVLPYLAAAAVVLVAYRGRDLLGRSGAALLAGLLGGAAPLLVDNLTRRSNSIGVFWKLNRMGGHDVASATLADHLDGGVLTGVPLAGGLCPPGRCGPAQTWWGVAFVVLLAAAGGLAVVGLRRMRRRGAASVRHAGRLALVVAAGATLISYVRSPAAVLSPIESARYLSLLAVSTPAVLFPVAIAPRLLRSPPARLLRAAAAAVVAALALAATVTAFRTAPAVRAEEDAQRQLAAALDKIGVTEIYSDYWTCGRLTFATRERVACATLSDKLHPDNDRYPRYRARVAAAPEPVFALVSGSQLQAAFAAHLARLGVDGHPQPAGRYVIYRPGRPVGLPLT